MQTQRPKQKNYYEELEEEQIGELLFIEKIISVWDIENLEMDSGGAQ